MATTVWDKIYKDYLNGGEAYVTLKGIIEPNFKKFVSETAFHKKNAFDIGYGTGNYLQYLKLQGFNVAGIDSSDTAQSMAAKNLGGKVGLALGNMYEFKIPKDKYDFIFSIRTLHHGKKEQVSNLIESIYSSLEDGGHLYITLPNMVSSNHWYSFEDRIEIAPGTFVPQSGHEKGLPHSFFNLEEVKDMFSKLNGLSIKEFEGNWHITGKK